MTPEHTRIMRENRLRGKSLVGKGILLSSKGTYIFSLHSTPSEGKDSAAGSGAKSLGKTQRSWQATSGTYYT
jgi:hypothetical protein